MNECFSIKALFYDRTQYVLHKIQLDFHTYFQVNKATRIGTPFCTFMAANFDFHPIRLFYSQQERDNQLQNNYHKVKNAY